MLTQSMQHLLRPMMIAIKFKCLIVTNDERRDHAFQLLGNDLFPRWKERHQVRFSFSDAGPEFHMPPLCSVVIQREETGIYLFHQNMNTTQGDHGCVLCVLNHV